MTFLDFCRMHGLRVDHVDPDSRWHRCPTEDKPRKRNGAWKFLGDVGFVQNHATMAEIAVWRPDDTMASPVDQAKHEARMRLVMQQEAKRRILAIRAAREYFAGLPLLMGGHPYLEAKGLSMRGCAGVKVDGDKLAIPMMLERSLISVQTIDPAGAKLYRAGCPTAGTSFVIGATKPAVTCWTEGFATGLAVHQCVPQARVVVCFDAGNLVRVAKASKATGLSVVCADNDWQGTTNTGVDKGRQAAETIGCGLAYPKGIAGTDWADAFKEWGAPKVRLEVLREAINVAPP